MSKSPSDQELVKRFSEIGPDDAGFPGLLSQVERRFSRMLVEDQVQVAERLSEFKESETAMDAVRAFYDAPGAGLAALILLGRVRGDVAPGLLESLETWLGLCEEEGGECDPSAFFSLPAKMRRAVLDHLALWLRADLLGRLAASAPDKGQLKAIKKALHRVKSQGVEVADGSGLGPAYLAPERDEFVDEAYFTPPDASGTMFVFLYRTVFGKNNLFVILVNDQDGVIKCEGHETPVPKFRRIIESTRQNPHAILVKSDPAFVRLLVKQAEASGLKRGINQNRDYLSSRRALGVADQESSPHPLWGRLDREEFKNEHGLAHRSGELLEHRLFEGWSLHAVEEGKFMVELSKILTSPIALTEAQLQERKRELFEQEARTAVETDGRETWRDRLLNCALVLYEIGDHDPARMTAATALALEDPERPLPPFFVELLERTADLENADDEEETEGPDLDRGGIVTA